LRFMKAAGCAFSLSEGPQIPENFVKKVFDDFWELSPFLEVLSDKSILRKARFVSHSLHRLFGFKKEGGGTHKVKRKLSREVVTKVDSLLLDVFLCELDIVLYPV